MSRRQDFSKTPHRNKPRGGRSYRYLENELHRGAGFQPAIPVAVVAEDTRLVASPKPNGAFVPLGERLEVGRHLSMPGLLPVDMIGRALGAIERNIIVTGDPRRERLPYVGTHELYPGGYEASPNAYAIMHRTEHALSRAALYDKLSVPLTGVEIVPQEAGIRPDQRIIKGAVWLAFDGSPLEEERRKVRELAELKAGNALRRVRVARIDGPIDTLMNEEVLGNAVGELTDQLPSEGTVYGFTIMDPPYDTNWKPVYPHPNHPDVQRERARAERDRRFSLEMPDWVRTMLEEQSA